MSKFTFTIAFLLISFGTLFCQNTAFDLEKILRNGSPEHFKRKVQDYVRLHPGTPEALYLQAMASQDGRESIELYTRIIKEFPESQLAEKAMYRNAHYYFSRGLYVAARREFLKLIEKHPNSQLATDALYFSAACLCASRKLDACKNELENFVKRYRKSDLTRLAREDLRELSTDSTVPASRSSGSPTTGKYTLQVGAFQVANNALNLRDYFSRMGLQAEIREKKTPNSKMYLVWVGSFESEASARLAGDNLKRDHGKPYRIVSR